MAVRFFCFFFFCLLGLGFRDLFGVFLASKASGFRVMRCFLFFFCVPLALKASGFSVHGLGFRARSRGPGFRV